MTDFWKPGNTCYAASCGEFRPAEIKPNIFTYLLREPKKRPPFLRGAFEEHDLAPSCLFLYAATDDEAKTEQASAKE